jgi:hypothetical protein
MQRLKEPLTATNNENQPLRRNVDHKDIKFVQKVIEETTTPTWINHVPANYGEAGAGSMKADEWRTLATIFLPIALVVMWSEQTGPHTEHFTRLLEHSMHLFQATTLVCRHATSLDRATRYREHIRKWLDGLFVCYPNLEKHQKRQNPHFAFHIYDCLLQFGPALNWWCFPTERNIGKLQQLNTNGRPDGVHERIILQTWTRMANLRRWLLRADCPPLLREFYGIMCRFLNIADDQTTVEHTNLEVNDGQSRLRAHYDLDGTHFSRA